MNRLTRLSLLSVVAISLAGCALPPLPKLPKLPNLGQVAKEVLPVTSTGQSLKEAASLAFVKADEWEKSANLVSLTGLKLDPGGRNGGHEDGLWILTFQAESKDKALEVRVKQGTATEREITKKVYQEAPLNRDLSAVLDSPDAVAKAGMGGRRLTIVLRQAADAPVYNIVEEGGTTRAVLDARTGEKRSE